MKYSLLTTCLVLILVAPVKAQSGYVPTFEDTVEVYEDLFAYEEPIHLTLQADMKAFRKLRTKDEYMPAVLTNHVSDSFQVIHPVRIKARGIHRRETCSYPPMWVNIRHSGIEAEDLQRMKIRRIKMVTRCRSSAVYEPYILREYLVYRILNIITPVSFNVRLIRLTIVDSSKDNRETEDWAFFIEPQEMMAERLNARVIKSDKLAMRSMSKESMDLVALFQYMIGNGDYSVTGRHNLKILAMDQPGGAGFVPVPYDFDYTGLVNTTYAVPGENLGIKHVRERYYLGLCRDDETLMAAIAELESYKDEIFDMILEFEYLDEEERYDLISYLQSFYNEAEGERFIDRSIASTCR